MVRTDNDEYLFRDEDFESENFDPAAFVAKYHRVSSLESLREQLRNYSKSVQSQLYMIINRDYKDFIGISTKVNKFFLHSTFDICTFFSLWLSNDNSWMD